MKKLPSLSIFFPCLNDAKIMPYLINKTYFIASKITDNFEIIVIDDGSADDSLKILNMLKIYYPKLKTIHHKKNLGYGSVLKEGFGISTKEFVFYTDGDGQYDPLQIEKLVNKINSKIDVVNGYKDKRSDSLLRQFTGYIYNAFLHHIYKLPISDIDCDFRLIRRSLLKNISLSASSGLICLELILKLKKAGARFTEVKISHYPRPFGHSQFFRIKHLFNTLNEHLKFYSKSKKDFF